MRPDARGSDEAGSLRRHRPAGGGRHGRGLSCARHPARSRRRRSRSCRTAFADDHGRRRALRARSAGHRRAVTSEHRRDLRHGRCDEAAHRRLYVVMELLEGETLRERLSGRHSRCARPSTSPRRSRAGSPRRTSKRHRPSRSQARERLPADRRARQDSRLRSGARQARLPAIGRRATPRGHHRSRHRDGHGRLHGARAGARPGRRRARRSVRARRGALRDARAGTARSVATRRGNDDGDSERRSAGLTTARADLRRRSTASSGMPRRIAEERFQTARDVAFALDALSGSGPAPGSGAIPVRDAIGADARAPGLGGARGRPGGCSDLAARDTCRTGRIVHGAPSRRTPACRAGVTLPLDVAPANRLRSLTRRHAPRVCRRGGWPQQDAVASIAERGESPPGRRLRRRLGPVLVAGRPRRCLSTGEPDDAVRRGRGRSIRRAGPHAELGVVGQGPDGRRHDRHVVRLEPGQRPSWRAPQGRRADRSLHAHCRREGVPCLSVVAPRWTARAVGPGRDGNQRQFSLLCD